MPNRGEILSRVMSLKEFSVGKEQVKPEAECWSGIEYGATFELMKLEGAIFRDKTPRLHAIIRGEEEGIGRLKEDFIVAFGEPETELTESRETLAHSLNLYWYTSKALASRLR